MRRNNKISRLTIIAEDKATSLIAQGFIHNLVVCRQNRCNPIRYTHGWIPAVEAVKALRLDSQTNDYVVLIIDFDRDRERRYKWIQEQLKDSHYIDRIYVLGSPVEVEKLLRPMRKLFNDNSLDLEGIGAQIAQECYDFGHFKSAGCEDSGSAWTEQCLRINLDVVQRLERDVKPFLFNSGEDKI